MFFASGNIDKYIHCQIRSEGCCRKQCRAIFCREGGLHFDSRREFLYLETFYLLMMQSRFLMSCTFHDSDTLTGGDAVSLRSPSPPLPSASQGKSIRQYCWIYFDAPCLTEICPHCLTLWIHSGRGSCSAHPSPSPPHPSPLSLPTSPWPEWGGRQPHQTLHNDWGKAPQLQAAFHSRVITFMENNAPKV